MADLSQQFKQAMVGIYYRAKSEAAYTATIFLSMIHSRGGVDTAKVLINSPRQSDGYTALMLKGRLDLTVEAMVVEDPKWHPLFTADEIERAEERLKKNGYVKKPKS